METPIFSIDLVDVNYRSFQAIRSVSLKLPKQNVLGLLGLNGAGKTTTIRALLGMVKPSKGTIRVFDFVPGSVDSLKRIGYAPEDGQPPEFLTAEEYLSFIAALKIEGKSNQKQAVQELLHSFELVPTKRIRAFSKGMIRRIILAQSFIGNPELLILDEPLNGLDPLFVIRLREKLEEYQQKGGSVLYSSHILSEVEKTCTDVAILSKGNLVFQNSVQNIQKDFGGVEAVFSKFAKETV